MLGLFANAFAFADDALIVCYEKRRLCHPLARYSIRYRTVLHIKLTADYFLTNVKCFIYVFFLFCCSFSVHILACCAEALPVSIRGKCFMEADFFFSAIAYDIALTFVSAAVSRHDSYVFYRIYAYVAAVAMEIVIAIA